MTVSYLSFHNIHYATYGREGFSPTPKSLQTVQGQRMGGQPALPKAAAGVPRPSSQNTPPVTTSRPRTVACDRIPCSRWPNAPAD